MAITFILINFLSWRSVLLIFYCWNDRRSPWSKLFRKLRIIPHSFLLCILFSNTPISLRRTLNEVSRICRINRLPVTKAWFLPQSSPLGICGGQIGTVTFYFLRVFFSCQGSFHQCSIFVHLLSTLCSLGAVSVAKWATRKELAH